MGQKSQRNEKEKREEDNWSAGRVVLQIPNFELITSRKRSIVRLSAR